MADPDHKPSPIKPSPIKGARNKRKAALIVTAPEGEPWEQTIARTRLDPVVSAGSFLANVHKCEPTAFVAELGKHAKAVTTGDLSRLEQMLTAQAHSLDALFYSLAHRSRANSAEGYVDAGETYMKLALRAQAQCRATAESIATIKNPPAVAFVRQANIAAGHQQVNNGVAPREPRAGNSENPPNKLLEAMDGERVDTGATCTASGVDKALETVGAIDRAEDTGR